MLRRGALALLATVAALAQPVSLKHRQEIERLISQEMSRQSIPGMSVAVVAGNEMLWSTGFGLADLENFVPAKASTVYRLGSVSKPVTAVAAMQLYEAGKLDLEAPVQRYVPSFPRKPWPITVRQLLGHLGGIRHYASPDEVNSTRYFPDLLAPLRLFQNDPLVAEPGTGFHYTTYGYVLLGAAVEAASAQRFMDYLRQRVFAPAGMDRIRQDHVFAVIPNRARGYTLGPSGQLQNCALADTSNKVPGGGLVSTVEDLARFATAMRKGVLLRPHTVDMMFTPQRLKDGKPTDYGLGWQVRSIESVKVVQHTGGQQGVSTILALQPRENVAVALMSNLERAQLQDLAHRILRLLAESPTGARQKSNFDQRPGLAAGR